MTQYNYQKLRGLIKEHFGSNEKYAKALGISPTTLQTRLNNSTYFNQEEIRKSNELFHITDPKISDQVFFARDYRKTDGQERKKDVSITSI